MEKREELLNGLYDVRATLGKMQEVMVEYINLERSFRTRQKKIETSGVKNVSKLVFALMVALEMVFFAFIGMLTGSFEVVIAMAVSLGIIFFKRKQKSKLKIAAIVCFAACFVGNLYLLITGLTPGIAFILILLMAVIVGGGYLLITGENRRVEAHNKEVEAHNQKVQAERTALYNQHKQLAAELVECSGNWFPPKYYNIAAVDFFIGVVENYRADTVKEMVNLFEQNEQFNQMVAYQQQQVQQLNQLIDGQQQIAGQLRFANMLNVAQVIQLNSINKGVQDLNAGVRDVKAEAKYLNKTVDWLTRNKR